MNHVKTTAKNLPHRQIAMLVYPDCVMMDAIGPMEVFNFANDILQYKGHILPLESVYTLSIVAEQRGSIKTSSGISLAADKSYHDIRDDFDTFMVAGANRQEYIDSALQNMALRTFLINIKPKVRRMASICTGALILAKAGLLNGRNATTHWMYCDQLSKQYREIKVQPDKIFVRDGDIYTSGGVSAGIDLALSLVEEDWGWEVAAEVARKMLIFMRRPGGQSQFSSYVFNDVKSRKDFRELRAWIVSNPATDLSVECLAKRMAMSPRNFSRLFCQEMDITPAKFVERVRLEAAKNLMIQTNQPVESVAVNCGFNSAEQMRRSFQRLMKTTPQDYRTLFKQTFG